MASIYPFRAWRHHPSAVRLDDVVTQPYDKISPAMQQAYYQKSPYNVVRIILSLPELFDAERGESVYTRAARDFRAWREQGVLRWSGNLGGLAVCRRGTLLGAIARVSIVLVSIIGVSIVGVSIARAQNPPNANPTRFVVVLDAAHGGDDAGGRLASGQLEKAATLAFSVRLRSLLAARGMTVVTTREADVTVEPAKRAEIANHAQAGACLSIHATESGSGIHLFTSSLAPTQPTQFLAWKTAQSAWITRSLALSGAINSALQHDGFNVTLSRTALVGVDNMSCPALALEIAPARGPDGKVTAEPEDAEYQARIANSLAAALLEWRMEAHLP